VSVRIVTLCTGNAARSVMAKLMLERARPDLAVEGAGTLVLEGQPMSVRTRRALERHDLEDLDHRSRQFGSAQLDADLIVAMEPEHLGWMARNHPEAVPRLGLLPDVVNRWPSEVVTIPQGVDRLALAQYHPNVADTVIDPAGGEQPEFDRCADELALLIDRLAALLPLTEPKGDIS
jgi:protein-tyrosine-phosphatase